MSKHQDSLSERRFKALIENLNEGIVIYDEKGIIQYASSSIKKMCGYANNELIGKNGADFLHPSDVDEARKKFSSLRSMPGKSISFSLRLRHKKRNYFWAEASLTNFLNNPDIKGIISNFRNIHEQRKTKEQVEETNKILETINRNLTEGIFMGVANKKFLYANEAFLKMMGFSSMEALKKIKPNRLYADSSLHHSFLDQVRKKGVVKDLEILFKRKNSETFWGKMNISSLTFQGQPDCFVGNIKDITKEREAQIQLQESQQLLLSLSNNVQEGVFRFHVGKGLLYANNAFIKLFGYRSRKELVKVSYDQFFFDKKEQAEHMNLLKKNGAISNVETRYQKKNGKLFWGLGSFMMLQTSDGKIFIDGAVKDITDQRQAAQELLNSRNFLLNVINTVAAPIFVKDKKHQWILFNDAFAEGNSREFYKGKSDYDLLPKKVADEIWKIDNEVLRTGITITREEILPQQNGSVRTVITTKSRYVDDKGNKFVIGFIMDITERKRFEEIVKLMNANLRGVLESTKDQILALDSNYCYTMFNRSHAHYVKRLCGKDIGIGDSYLAFLPTEVEAKVKKEISRALKGENFTSEQAYANKTVAEITYNVIDDDRRRITGVALFIRDMTHRKSTEAKLQALNEELTQHNWQLAAQEEELKNTLEELSERNFELDQLMYKTSHDLRSPLSSIMGLVNLAQLDKDPTNRDLYINKIEGRIKKLDEFIKSMLNYARVNRAEINITTINLEETARTAIRELEYLENFKEVEAIIKVKEGSIPFRSDPLRINIIFSNVISNAYKYFNPEKKSFLKITINVDPAKAVIEFKDNGIGIKKEYLDKIFNMFYRATDRSQGSGLGMYIVKQAIELLRGEVKIKSRFGVGTILRITLPNSFNFKSST